MLPSQQPEWMASVVVGSVVRERGGRYRVVRDVKRNKQGGLTYVTLLITRPSWTNRCYTVLTASDLKTRGFQLVPVRPVKLKGEFNRQVERAIRQPAKEPYILCAKDVIGVP